MFCKNCLWRRGRPRQSAPEPICPTCDQPLTEDHRHHIIEELSGEVESRRARYRENQTQLKTLVEHLSALDQKLNQVNAELRERPNLQRKLGDLQAKVVTATEARAQIEKLNERRARWLAGLDADQTQRTALEAEAAGHAARAI